MARSVAAHPALGEIIRSARTARGWSREDLASAAHITRNFVLNIERGDNVSIDVLQRVAAALSIQELPLGSARLRFGDGDAKGLTASQLASRIESDAADLRRALSSSEARNVVSMKPRTRQNEQPPDLLSAPGSPFRPPQRHLVDDDWIDVVIEGRVAAGPPIDYEEREIARVPPDEAPEAGWHVLEAWGDSMVDFGIESGDLVYVEPRRGGVAATGEVVIGWLNDGLVIKEWEQRKKRRLLKSANSAIEPREITSDDIWELRAIVRKVVQRRPRAHLFPNISGKNR